MKNIWSYSTKEEIISALWMIAAMVAFIAPSEGIAYRALHYLGIVMLIHSIFGFICAIRSAKREVDKHFDKLISQSPQNDNNDDSFYILSPFVIDATFTEKHGMFELRAIIPVDRKQFVYKPTDQEINDIIQQELKKWLLGSFNVVYKIQSAQKTTIHGETDGENQTKRSETD